MIEDLTFITGNPSKAERLKYHLKLPIKHRKIDLVEIQSVDLDEVVEHKVREAYRKVHGPVLIEDVSLAFHALKRLPGPLIKWFLLELGNEGLCRLLDNYPDRSAIAEVCYGLYDGKTLKTFKGSSEGTIVQSPRGSENFGWDPTFEPLGYSQTWAEMSDAKNEEALNATSMRRKALKKLEDYLLSIKI